MGRGLIILLIASLGLNIFAVGHLSGLMIAGGPPKPRAESHHRSGLDDPFKLMRYAEELSPELRDQFRDEFKKQLPKMREDHRQVRALRRELGVLMSADPWDREAVNAKLDEIRALQDQKFVYFNEAFVNAFETLPAAERKRLIDAANAKRLERKKKKYRRGQREGGPGKNHPGRPGDERPDDRQMPPPPPEE